MARQLSRRGRSRASHLNPLSALAGRYEDFEQLISTDRKKTFKPDPRAEDAAK